MDIRIETSISDEQKQVFLNIIKESFRSLANKGQDCSCYRYTMQDFDDLVMANHHLFAFVGSKPVGLTSCRINTKKKYCYMVVSAIIPEFQKYGIGTMLTSRVTEICQTMGCRYILSDTDVNNIKSVRWHLKNGYRIIGYQSYSSTNYYSYIFRKDLRQKGFFVNHIYYPLRFAISYLAIHIAKKEDGSLTFVGKCINRIIKRV